MSLLFCAFSLLGYWDAFLHFSWGPDDKVTYLPKGTQLIVIVTPENGGSLLDGLATQTITKTFTVGNKTNYY